MGLWQATIVGIGTHDSDFPQSSEKMIAAAVEQLRAAGHTVLYASVGCPPNFTARGTYGEAGVFGSVSPDANIQAAPAPASAPEAPVVDSTDEPPPAAPGS